MTSQDRSYEPGPVAALRRVAFLMERGREETRRVQAFRNAAATILPLPATEVATRVEAGTLTELAGIGPSTAAVIEAAVRGEVPERLAKLEREYAGPLTAGGHDLRRRLRGDLHSHSDWSDGGSPIEEMAFTAMELGHEYLVLTDHSPRLTVANGLSPARLTKQLGVVEAVNDHLAGSDFTLLKGIEVDILDDGGLDQTDELLRRLDVRVASVHSKLKMEPDAMTRRMIGAIRNPLTNVLGHCTGPLGHRQPRHPTGQPLRRAGGLRGLRRARRRRRDQLPTGTSRPADEAARARPRRRLPILDRLRQPRPGPARLPRLRVRARGGGRHRGGADRQHVAPRAIAGLGCRRERLA